MRYSFETCMADKKPGRKKGMGYWLHGQALTVSLEKVKIMKGFPPLK